MNKQCAHFRTDRTRTFHALVPTIALIVAGGTTSVCWAGHEYGDALYRSMAGAFANWGHT